MSQLMLNTRLLSIEKLLAIVFALTGLVFMFLRDKEENVSNATNSKEFLFCIFKAVVYLLLAQYIYRYYIKKSDIPIIDFFTFTLGIFEGLHNLLNSLGNWVVVIVKSFRGMFFSRN
ncbi:nicotinamide mononucleotide transporter [Clostridium pasteurianum]|uniref:Uncharacterized protein n=1 Tax=Clostridium pasteurianum BC1 TaxID=86416 RepID=R4JZZ7_CLOPA|nr:nicotinamide mononucleotide transporter [Clostridium pasteurianum]AGK96412.1 hypothetical protein Clopa_1437 [Clostridium pasteurianum BC1]